MLPLLVYVHRSDKGVAVLRAGSVRDSEKFAVGRVIVCCGTAIFRIFVTLPASAVTALKVSGSNSDQVSYLASSMSFLPSLKHGERLVIAPVQIMVEQVSSVVADWQQCQPELQQHDGTLQRAIRIIHTSSLL